GIRSQKPITLYNGALECKLLRFTIEESRFFIPKAKTQEERIAQVIAISKTEPPVIDTEKIARVEKALKPEAEGRIDKESGKAKAPIIVEAATNKEDSKVGAIEFANRLKKNFKKLSKWARQNEITCYRVYDADLPEYAAAVDIYQGEAYRSQLTPLAYIPVGEQTWINVQEYEPPKTIDQHKADQRLAGLLAEIPHVLGVNSDHIFLKIRRKQRSTDQYEKHGELGRFHTIEEGGCKLLVNFEDYLDTGLFLDHRPIRLLIQQQAKNKRFLNLFAYTGTATVHAAMGGATSTTTVDMSNTYTEWAKNNMALNKHTGEHEFIQADCLEWLANEAKKAEVRHYDLIFLDPPTFSNSKRMEDVFDIQNDHAQLIKNAVTLLAPEGILYFSTNFRRFKIDSPGLSELTVEDISAATIPEDFSRNPRIHYCWKITK
ncbi:MAG: hypothetical protein RIR39_1658, partial [Pseudomonadota bacterium]